MRKAVLCVTTLLCACAHMEVLELGAGRHSVTGTSRTGVADAREDAVGAANAYCADRQKTAVIDSIDDKTGLSPLLSASSSVVFRCQP